MIFDAIVVVAVFISAVIAFLRGLIRELLTIVGVVGGALAAIFIGPMLLPAINNWLGVTNDPDHVKKLFDVIPMTVVAGFCSYGLVFIVVVIVLSILSYFLSSGAKALGLGPVDRALGVIFGIARAALLLSLLYLPVYMLTNGKERDQWSLFQGSKTRPFLEQGAAWIAGFMPENKEKTIDDKAKEARRELKDSREQLQKMDALKSAVDKAGSMMDTAKDKINDAKDSAQPADDKSGYKNDQRQNLDNLIQKNQ
jgi:membrane protein required for colicin V production